MNPNKTKDRLKRKLKKRNAARTGGSSTTPESDDEDKGYEELMKQVNMAMSGNPSMLSQLNKCVNNIVSNKSLMESLIRKVDKNMQEGEDLVNDTVFMDSVTKLVKEKTENQENQNT